MTVKRKRHRKPLPWLRIESVKRGRICAIAVHRTLRGHPIAEYTLHSTKGWRRYSWRDQP